MYLPNSRRRKTLIRPTLLTEVEDAVRRNSQPKTGDVNTVMMNPHPPNGKRDSSSNHAKATPNSEEEINVIHETLQDPRRRHALRALHTHGPLGKKELATLVAAAENDKHPDELDEQEHKRVVVSLHQAHLPFLSKHRFVAWDQETNVVALGPRSDLVLQHIYGIGLVVEDDE